MKIIMDEWEEILKAVYIRMGVSELSYQCWLQPLKIIDHNTEKLVIYVENKVAIDYIRNKYASTIVSVIRDKMGKDVQLIFTNQK